MTYFNNLLLKLWFESYIFVCKIRTPCNKFIISSYSPIIKCYIYCNNLLQCLPSHEAMISSFISFCFLFNSISLHSKLQTSAFVSSQMYSPYLPHIFISYLIINHTTHTGSPGSGNRWSFENSTTSSSDIQ